MEVIALRDVYSTVPSVGRRSPREVFSCPDALALELIEYGMVKRAAAPKPQQDSSAGKETPPASSLPAAPASRQSKPTQPSKPTSKAGAKQSR